MQNNILLNQVPAWAPPSDKKVETEATLEKQGFGFKVSLAHIGLCSLSLFKSRTKVSSRFFVFLCYMICKSRGRLGVGVVVVAAASVAVVVTGSGSGADAEETLEEVNAKAIRTASRP